STAADFFFQAVFVATCMSIVSGAIAERMKLWVFLVFAVVMTGLIYPISGSWGWGGQAVFGLYSLSEDFAFKDFAGSGLVHLVGASAALAGVMLLGPRLGKYGERGETRAIPGANLPLATQDRKSTRLNSSHVSISYAVFCLKKKRKQLDDKTCTLISPINYKI